MHRLFISTIVAAALTVTGISATMAQAGEYRYVQPRQSNGGNEAVAAALAGIAALFIIGKTIERNKDRREKVIIRKSPPPKAHKPRKSKKAHRGHGHKHRHAHRNHRRNHWHTHSNGLRHKHPHGPRHHYGRH